MNIHKCAVMKLFPLLFPYVSILQDSSNPIWYLKPPFLALPTSQTPWHTDMIVIFRLIEWNRGL